MRVWLLLDDGIPRFRLPLLDHPLPYFRMIIARSLSIAFAGILLISGGSAVAWAQPQAHVDGLTIESTGWRVDAVRIGFNPLSEMLLVAGLGGDISSIDPSPSNERVTLRYRNSDHGAPVPLMGMAIASDGTIYLVGNDAGSSPGNNIGVVRRGVPDGQGGHIWETVATTEPYPRSATPFDHNVNAIVLSPDETELYLNSGSRTDHGEVQDNNGQFPGVREVPLTSAILRIPATATDLVLPNDEQSLLQGGYLFADGTRNTFSLAFDGVGRLFGTENSGDRDDEEELNLIEEGRQYGFPWRMGMTDTPMQFPGYDPSSDLLLNGSAIAVQSGFFYDDPSYPLVPDGVTFTDPVLNLGPDADLYRDPASGTILDASDTGRPMGTFTAHRSPLGLVFDVNPLLPPPYSGDGFMLSWTGGESGLLGPYAGEGEDLMHLTFEDGDTGPAVRVERLVSGFLNPIDAVQVGQALYVLEFGSGARVWRIGFGSSTASEGSGDTSIPTGPVVDIWPNPAAGMQRARIQAARTGRIQATLVNSTGQELRTVLDTWLVQGQSLDIPLETQSLSRGVYFLVVRAPGARRAHSLVIQ